MIWNTALVSLLCTQTNKKPHFTKITFLRVFFSRNRSRFSPFHQNRLSCNIMLWTTPWDLNTQHSPLVSRTKKSLLGERRNLFRSTVSVHSFALLQLTETFNTDIIQLTLFILNYHDSFSLCFLALCLPLSLYIQNFYVFKYLANKADSVDYSFRLVVAIILLLTFVSAPLWIQAIKLWDNILWSS